MHTQALQLLTPTQHAAKHSRIRNIASYVPIPWCFKASRDCTSHGHAPQHAFGSRFKNVTRSQRTHTTEHAHRTGVRTEGASMTQRRNNTGQATNDTRQRRGTHWRKHTRQQMQPCSFYLTTRHPRSHTLTNGDRSSKPTLSTAVLTNQGLGATVRRACGRKHWQRGRSPARHAPAHGSDCLFAIRCHTMRVEPGQH